MCELAIFDMSICWLGPRVLIAGVVIVAWLYGTRWLLRRYFGGE